MQTMFQLLRSESFIQSLLLLAATAALTGVLVPLIKGYMDDRKFRQQKLFEAELARQGKVIEAQVQFLESLAQLVWDFQLLALSVSYYKTLPDEKRFQLAFDEYDKESWVFFSKIRTEISKARRLTSERTYQVLLKYYEDWLMKNDNALMSLVKRRASHEDWLNHHNLLYNGAENTDKIMTQLAEEFRLVGHGRKAEAKH